MARASDDSGGRSESGATGGDGPILLWFRRDLRIRDNLALSAAIETRRPIVALYILDDGNGDVRALGGAQQWWLHHSLDALRRSLSELGLPIVFRRGKPGPILDAVIAETGATDIWWNRRYDAGGVSEDKALKASLRDHGLTVKSHAGQLLHEPTQLLTGKGDPYRVYTPFWRAFEKAGEPRAPLPAPGRVEAALPSIASDSLSDWALLPRRPDWSGGLGETWTPGEDGARRRLEDFIGGTFSSYDEDRDRPDREGTSRLSPHLAFGEITPAQIWEASQRRPKEVAAADRTTFRKEIVWREFAYHLLFHYPDLPRDNFNSRFDRFPWKAKGDTFKAWSKGETGYPIVDAGMRQLWQTGWMHNRVRMIVASFLTKHLLIDWREGEAWFWDTLVDADPASNASQWQWVAGSGADAAPYFRIFNPVIQGEKFDPDGDYVRSFVPEIAKLETRYLHKPWDAPAHALDKAGVALGKTYPHPVVDHKMARERALKAYDAIKDAA